MNRCEGLCCLSFPKGSQSKDLKEPQLQAEGPHTPFSTSPVGLSWLLSHLTLRSGGWLWGDTEFGRATAHSGPTPCQETPPRRSDHIPPQVAWETLGRGWGIQGTVAQQQVVPSLPPSCEATVQHPLLTQRRAAPTESQKPGTHCLR